VPSIPASLGNFFLPLQLGAKDVAFPRLNLFSWYIYVFGSIFGIASILMNGVDTGWTFYTPFSTTYSNSYVVLTIVGIFIAGFSSIFTGLNFIVTIHRMRAPGLSWFRLPLFIWSHYATSLVIVLGTPVVAITLALVAVERTLHLGIFDPALGGDPLLFQHLFWFYSHPAVYIMILPSMGVISELIAAFARKKVFGYHFVAFASIAIAVLGFLVWGHHMFVTGQSVYAATVFSVLSMLVAIPSAVKVFNWTATMWKGSMTFETPMLFAIGFVILFTIGGLSGVMLAIVPADFQYHDTYFVVAHFHYVMVAGAVFSMTAAIYYWLPKWCGKMYNETMGKTHFWISFVGFNLTFFPQHFLGMQGMARRYPDFTAAYSYWNEISSLGYWIMAGSMLLFFANLAYAFLAGKKAENNPWGEGATTLEWTLSSPPPFHQFETLPVIEDHHDYHDHRPAGA